MRAPCADTTIYDHVFYGSLSELRADLANGLRPSSGQPLLLAARRSFWDCMRELIPFSDVNYRDRDGQSALSETLYKGGPDALAIARELLDAGADPLFVDQLGLTTLHWAAAGGCPDCLSLALSLCGSSLNALGGGRTPLMLAASYERARGFALLLPLSDLSVPSAEGLRLDQMPLSPPLRFLLEQHHALAERQALSQALTIAAPTENPPASVFSIPRSPPRV